MTKNIILQNLKGNGLDGVASHQTAQRLGRGFALLFGRVEVDHGVVQQVALGVQADDLAAGPYAGVDGERRPYFAFL